jgi:RHS repeat-associated protein
VLERRYDNDTRLTYLDDTNTLDAGYDGLRRPVQLRHLRGDNSLIVGFTHTYDRLNNKLNEGKLHDLANSEVYGYDAAYRLTNFDRPDPSAQQPLYREWALDGAGNWQQVDAEARQHSSFNELLERNVGTIISLRYDHNGNQIDDGAFTFQWDTFNRLHTITRKADNALVAMYSYDAAGRRIRRVVTNADALNGTTHFYLDGWQEIEERDGAGSLVQQYVYGGGYIDELLMLDRNLDGDATATGAGDQQLFYHQNMLYSVYALTDNTARIVDGYQYDAYGRQTVYTPGSNGAVEFGGDDVIAAGGVSGVGNPYLFTGRRLDGETKLYYYRMRYFDAIQGRFTQRDLIGVWEDMRNLGNGYTYVANNPLSYSDPSGLAMPCSSTQSGTVVNIKVCGNLIYNKSGAKLTKTYKHSTTVSAEFGAEYKGLSGKLATEHTEEEEESFELCPGQCVKYCYHYQCTCAKEYWEPSSWTWWVTGIGDFYMWNCEKTGEGLEDCTQAERDSVGVK